MFAKEIWGDKDEDSLSEEDEVGYANDGRGVWHDRLTTTRPAPVLRQPASVHSGNLPDEVIFSTRTAVQRNDHTVHQPPSFMASADVSTTGAGIPTSYPAAVNEAQPSQPRSNSTNLPRVGSANQHSISHYDLPGYNFSSGSSSEATTTSMWSQQAARKSKSPQQRSGESSPYLHIRQQQAMQSPVPPRTATLVEHQLPDTDEFDDIESDEDEPSQMGQIKSEPGPSFCSFGQRYASQTSVQQQSTTKRKSFARGPQSKKLVCVPVVTSPSNNEDIGGFSDEDTSPAKPLVASSIPRISPYKPTAPLPPTPEKDPSLGGSSWLHGLKPSAQEAQPLTVLAEIDQSVQTGPIKSSLAVHLTRLLAREKAEASAFVQRLERGMPLQSMQPLVLKVVRHSFEAHLYVCECDVQHFSSPHRVTAIFSAEARRNNDISISSLVCVFPPWKTSFFDPRRHPLVSGIRFCAPAAMCQYDPSSYTMPFEEFLGGEPTASRSEPERRVLDFSDPPSSSAVSHAWKAHHTFLSINLFSKLPFYSQSASIIGRVVCWMPGSCLLAEAVATNESLSRGLQANPAFFCRCLRNLQQAALCLQSRPKTKTCAVLLEDDVGTLCVMDISQQLSSWLSALSTPGGARVEVKNAMLYPGPLSSAGWNLPQAVRYLVFSTASVVNVVSTGLPSPSTSLDVCPLLDLQQGARASTHAGVLCIVLAVLCEEHSRITALLSDASIANCASNHVVLQVTSLLGAAQLLALPPRSTVFLRSMRAEQRVGGLVCILDGDGTVELVRAGPSLATNSTCGVQPFVNMFGGVEGAALCFAPVRLFSAEVLDGLRAACANLVLPLTTGATRSQNGIGVSLRGKIVHSRKVELQTCPQCSHEVCSITLRADRYQFCRSCDKIQSAPNIEWRTNITLECDGALHEVEVEPTVQAYQSSSMSIGSVVTVECVLLGGTNLPAVSQRRRKARCAFKAIRLVSV